MALLMSLVITMTSANRYTEIIPHFRLEEFACRDGDPTIIIHPRILILTDVLRRLYNNPILITSAYRNRSHNQDVGGHPNSYHLKGEAIDFELPITRTKEFVQLCKSVFPHCLVNYERRYIHCDLANSEYNWHDL